MSVPNAPQEQDDLSDEALDRVVALILRAELPEDRSDARQAS